MSPSRFLLPSLLLLAGTLGLAQSSPSPAVQESYAKADAVLANMNRVDFLGKILPLNLKKDQINALLTALEKARAQERDIRGKDAVELAKLDDEVAKAVDAAIAEQNVPSVELQNKIIRVTKALAIRRQVATGEMTNDVYAVCARVLDPGQLKVMGEILRPDLVAPGTDRKAMGDADKQKFFIRYILLDGVAYDVLTKMGKAAK